MSLHIPEAKEMQDFLKVLKALHKKHGFTYTADVGPLGVLDAAECVPTFGISEEMDFVWYIGERGVFSCILLQ